MDAEEHKKTPPHRIGRVLEIRFVVNDPLPPDASQGYEYYYHEIDLVDEAGSNGTRGFHVSFMKMERCSFPKPVVNGNSGNCGKLIGVL